MSDERYVDAPPAGAAGWGDVWRENRRYRTRGGLQSFLNRIFRRGAAADLDRQRRESRRRSRWRRSRHPVGAGTLGTPPNYS